MKSAEAAPLYRRLWLLALVSGVERAGRTPLDLRSLNGLAYLANAAAPCYDIEPLDATVRKSEDGPMYPQLIWDVDRLVGMGLLSVSGLVLRKAEVRTCAYSMTRRGADLLARTRKSQSHFEELAAALWAVSLAFARSPRSIKAQSLYGRDANYAEHRVAFGDVVDFGDWEIRNWTQDAIDRVQTSLALRLHGGSQPDESQSRSPLVRNASVAVDLYAQYLAETPAAKGTER